MLLALSHGDGHAGDWPVPIALWQGGEARLVEPLPLLLACVRELIVLQLPQTEADDGLSPYEHAQRAAEAGDAPTRVCKLKLNMCCA